MSGEKKSRRVPQRGNGESLKAKKEKTEKIKKDSIRKKIKGPP